MSRKPPVMPEEIQQIEASVAPRRMSHLEDNYGQFHERTINASGPAGRLMTQMNQIYTICSGLGAVMRIVSGAPVVADLYDPEDMDSEPPLGATTISELTNMAAAVCEMISDEIDSTAGYFNDRGHA